MSCSSRTGLVATPNKTRKYLRKKSLENASLPKKFEALPMALSLRPFGGLFNPFAKGCSVLCNHPAPLEVKEIINQCKQSLAVEGKNVQHLHECKLDQSTAQSQVEATTANTDNIPDDLFRRYTDTDSRPLTPTPTVTSVLTRTSGGSFLNNRRCITPELGKNDIIKRKKIILDLRRSHSQETLYWKPSSDLSSGFADSEPKTKSAGANEDKKTRKQKPDDQRPKSSLATTTIPEEDQAADSGVEIKKAQQLCINEQEFGDDDSRRGKKRKKIKPIQTPSTTTFHLSEDPETQVAALGPDSLNASTRPSLIPNSVSLLPNKEKRESEQILLKDSFLTEEAFDALKTELDVDVIENTFGNCLNRALREAFRYIPPKAQTLQAISAELDKLNMICDKMPRKFSKSATRFDVPMNMKLLEEITVVGYLSEYVWICRQRKQIYKRIFLKHLNPFYVQETPAQDSTVTEPVEYEFPLPEYEERCMLSARLYDALEEVLEFHGTENNIRKVLNLIDYEEKFAKEINFRTWCGIVAFAERLALDDDPDCTDSCHELEKADFSSMYLRLHRFKIHHKLMEVLKIIRNTHNIKY